MTRSLVAILIVVILVGAATLAFFWHKSVNNMNDHSLPAGQEGSAATDTVSAVVPVGAVVGDRFIANQLGFSFVPPAGYHVGGFSEGATSQMIVVQPASGDAKQSFQIFINPIDQDITLTPEFIKADLPGTEVKNASAVVLDNKAKGIMFESNNAAFGGRSFEIWFVYNKNVYQITSYMDFASKLKNIIGTWKFNG